MISLPPNSLWQPCKCILLSGFCPSARVNFWIVSFCCWLSSPIIKSSITSWLTCVKVRIIQHIRTLKTWMKKIWVATTKNCEVFYYNCMDNFDAQLVQGDRIIQTKIKNKTKLRKKHGGRRQLKWEVKWRGTFRQKLSVLNSAFCAWPSFDWCRGIIWHHDQMLTQCAQLVFNILETE